MVKGVLAVILASVAYGIMPVFSKLAMETGLQAQNVVFYRFLLSFLFSGIMMIFTRTPAKANCTQLRDMGFFGICGFGLTILLLTCSYQFIPTGMATMFHFSYPLFVALVMAALYKEPLNRRKLAACVCALAGLLFMADFSGNPNFAGILLALLSGITYAVFVIAGKKASYQTLPPLTVVFYCSMSASIVFGIKTLWNGNLILPHGTKAWGSLIMISLICTVFALSMLTAGIRLLGASTASIINMAEPVTSVAAGVFVFCEPLTVKIIAGSILVVASGILFVGADYRNMKFKQHAPKSNR